MSKKHSKTENPNLEKALKVLIASVIGIALTVGALLLSCALALRNDLSGMILMILAFVSCLVPSFIAGFIAGKAIRKSGILYGALSAVPMCLFLIVLCAAFYGSLGGKLALCSVCMLLLGATGGICAVNTHRKRRYR